MGHFRFRLERLLELRTRVRRQCERDLRAAQQTQHRLHRDLADLTRAAAGPDRPGLERDTGAAWSYRQSWQRKLAARRLFASQQARDLADEVESRASTLRDAVAGEAALTRLQQRRQSEHDYALRRRQQKQLDQHARHSASDPERRQTP